ncbi:MAG: RNA polymerase-associated protein RapA [Desulfobacteraceae bacterium]|nr:RNA polymerase-associated protein RapA [Desulfobacteraceae bacterium]
MPRFVPGQRWISETEPELGLGMVLRVEPRRVEIAFPAADITRQYAAAAAPIKRVKFQAGDLINGRDEQSFNVRSISEIDGLIYYHGDGCDLPESSLSDTISFNTPEMRLINGHLDPSMVFDLRYKTLVHQWEYKKSPIRGFMGGRVELLPHQFFIAHEVCSRQAPRVLLADEVGLGKTIEACLIIHRLLCSGMISRVLILVPETLVHQWFVELLRKFNLLFDIVDDKYRESVDQGTPGANPFEQTQMVLCNINEIANSKELFHHMISTDWDLLVVDEAHHLTAGRPSHELVAKLGTAIKSVLLLTATPEQLGQESHFARLKILDPDRYHEFETFLKTAGHYQQIAGIADKLMQRKKLNPAESRYLRERYPELSLDPDPQSPPSVSQAHADPAALTSRLLDRHGIGRVMFRNTRKVIRGFPKRQVHLVPLHPDGNPVVGSINIRTKRVAGDADLGGMDGYPTTAGDGIVPKVKWLAALLRRSHEEKYLLICRQREMVDEIDTQLKKIIHIHSAVFHEDLSLIQRDRNAAWFSESDGAKILICSEIGSEGRNFQFARHLILFDLPTDPEVLEQRIGRLDRIGQRYTIQIHIPYMTDSPEETMVRWYHEGLNAFESQLPGGNMFLAKFGEKVNRIALDHQQPGRDASLETLITDTRDYRSSVLKKLGQGRDRLLELSSLIPDIAAGIIRRLRESDAGKSLEALMMEIWDFYGIKADEQGGRTYRLESGSRFDEAFPCYSDAMLVTFDRQASMVRENIRFLSWDHPMVTGAMELLLGSETGNASAAVLQNDDFQGLLIEAVFVLETIAPLSLHLDRYLPPTPIRMVINHLSEDCTSAYPQDWLNAHTAPVFSNKYVENIGTLSSQISTMLQAGRQKAQKTTGDTIKKILDRVTSDLNGEIERLVELRKINPDIRESEILMWQSHLERTCAYIGKARLRLDAVRLIIGEES